MNQKLRLVLDWAIPILCLANMIMYWEDINFVLAWLVAFAGWSVNLINRYKKS